jgi:hypothetical protein
MPYIIQVVERVDGDQRKAGQFVKAYDPTVHRKDGGYNGGLLEFTPDRQQALAFEDVGEALEKWRQPAGCACHGRRSDSKLNRPLTAYTVEVVKL